MPPDPLSITQTTTSLMMAAKDNNVKSVSMNSTNPSSSTADHVTTIDATATTVSHLRGNHSSSSSMTTPLLKVNHSMMSPTSSSNGIAMDSFHQEEEVTHRNDELSSSPKLPHELLTVTLHLSSSHVIDHDNNRTVLSSSSTTSAPAAVTQQQCTEIIRVILIPIRGLEQRETEMIQTARALQIPSSRWNGSLLYTIYQQQQNQKVVSSSSSSSSNGGTNTTDVIGDSNRRVTLHLYQNSDLKWSATPPNNNDSGNNHNPVVAVVGSNNNPTTTATTGLLTSTTTGISCIHKNIDLDWIQTYYVTGRISIPSHARGYDVLWLLEYFQFMYQPDQFQFANYATYTRVQLWSKYFCYLRPKLIDWIVNEISQQQQQQLKEPPTNNNNDNNHCRSMTFPLVFGTMCSNETSVELGTDRLLPLGDVTTPFSITSKVGGCSKRTLADRALKLFNSASCIEASTSRTMGGKQLIDAGTYRSGTTDEAQSQTTVPCPEELTATEIRNDFCRFLTHVLSENDVLNSSKNSTTNRKWNIQFTVRPVTVHYNYEDSTNTEGTNGINSTSSSSSSLPITSGSAVNSESVSTNTSNKSNKIVVHQRYLVAHRAVLVIDAQTMQSPELDRYTQSSHQRQERLSVKACRTKSELSAPVDELVEEEIAKGRLEELLLQVETRNNNNKIHDNDERRVTINETLSFEKEKIGRINEESKSFDTPLETSTISYQKSSDILDLNVPDDELNASLDAGNVSFNASMGNVPLSMTKKKKKPKPVFVLPEKLLDGDDNVPPQLARMKLPIVKSSPIFVSKTTGVSLPGPITIVRKGTFDNTVTSALTGPFYIDDNGILRDVFDNCEPDSDEDYEGDEDTRAQARRHEWIQTALLNRGIGERMETLLKEDGEPTPRSTTTTFDPWDWITGINVCEFSRDVIKSVEQYTNCVLCDGSMVTNRMSSTNDMANTSPTSPTADPLPLHEMMAVDPAGDNVISSNEVPVNPIRACIRTVSYCAPDDQSKEDKNIDHIVENIVFTTELDSLVGSVGSQGSKDSPRGVQRFDAASSVDKLTAEFSGSDHIDTPTCQSVKNDTVTLKTPEKKIRGIKGLFRRKRVDAVLPK